VEAVFDPLFWAQLLGKSLFLAFLGAAFVSQRLAGFVNLGISAQLIGGAMVGCYVGSASGSTVLALTATFLATNIIGALPVVLKYIRDVDEVLVTLFLVFIAVPVGQLIMNLSGDELTVATPRLSGLEWWGRWELVDYVTVVHLTAPVLIVCAYIYFKMTPLGYQSSVLRYNPSAIIGQAKRLRIALASNVFASTMVALAVIGDTFILKGRYTSGDYDFVGFLGVAVGLMACDRLIMILPVAMFVAVIEMLFLLLSVEFGFPQMSAYVLYGAGILLAAVLLKRLQTGGK